MANKYVDSTQTFDGDGTLSTAAGSDGAAGAWNNLTDVLNDSLSFGSIVAGDHIFMRAHDGTSDISVTMSGIASLPSSNSANRTIFQADNGAIWNAGTLTIKGRNSSGDQFIVGDWTALKGADNANRNLVVQEGRATNGFSPKTLTIQANALVEFIVFDALTGSTGQRGLRFGDGSVAAISYIRNSTIKASTTSTIGLIYPVAETSELNMFNVEIDMTGAGSSNAIFSNTNTSAEGGSIRWLTGSITNALDTQVIIKAITSNSLDVYLEDVDVGAMPPFHANASTQINSQVLTVINYDSQLDVSHSVLNGYSQWQKTGNYPTLNAVLGDSLNTGWSFKVFPNFNAVLDKVTPYKVPPTKKIVQTATAIRTITAEMLIKNTFASPLDDEFYFEISYIDGSGNFVVESSQGVGGALTASTAGWSATIYGAASYDKYKLELTTTQTVLLDTVITMQIFCARNDGTTSEDFFFFDPEFEVA